MDLLTTLQEDMKSSLKAGKKDRLLVIRMLISEVKIIDMDPKKPTQLQAVEAYAKKLRKGVEEYEKLSKPDEANKLRTELAIVEEFLPRRLDKQQTEALIDTFLAANPFTEKQAGQATGAFMKAHGGQVDAAIVNPLIRAKLAGK